jgi:hypothetical protein
MASPDLCRGSLETALEELDQATRGISLREAVAHIRRDSRSILVNSQRYPSVSEYMEPVINADASVGEYLLRTRGAERQ